MGAEEEGAPAIEAERMVDVGMDVIVIMQAIEAVASTNLVTTGLDCLHVHELLVDD